MNKKKGFTLAETLIALAIIGVIAGIMLPVINNSRPNQEMVMLKKAYYLAGKSVSELVNDEVLYPETDNNLGLANVEAVTYRGVNYSGNTKFCGLLAAKMNATCNNNSFTTSDGMVWNVVNGGFPHGVAVLRVHVNNDTVCSDTVNSCNKPNSFRMVVRTDGNLSVNGNYASHYLAEKNNTKKAEEFNITKNSLQLPDDYVGNTRGYLAYLIDKSLKARTPGDLRQLTKEEELFIKDNKKMLSQEELTSKVRQSSLSTQDASMKNFNF